MTEAAPDQTNFQHDIDDLFQLLVRVRDIPPAIAKQQIFEYLQLDKLRVNSHIRGGARKTRPMRQATLEELRIFEALNEALRERKAPREEMEEEMARANAFLYEHAPPEGITEPVPFQSWGVLYRLSIRDGHLIVEPICALDYPWDALSFTIANWSHVNELWPPRPSQQSLTPNSQASSESATKPPRPGTADFWIDVVASNRAWGNLPGKQLHSLTAKHIDDLNVENEREAKKQSQKPPPKIKCPGVRAFQIAVANRHRRERQGQAQ